MNKKGPSTQMHRTRGPGRPKGSANKTPPHGKGGKQSNHFKNPQTK